VAYSIDGIELQRGLRFGEAYGALRTDSGVGEPLTEQNYGAKVKMNKILERGSRTPPLATTDICTADPSAAARGDDGSNQQGDVDYSKSHLRPQG
jgi:hypothetical protein